MAVSKVILAGSQDGEHLSIEHVDNGRLAIISHELSRSTQRWPFNTYNMYRERILCTVQASVLKSALEVLANE